MSCAPITHKIISLDLNQACLKKQSVAVWHFPPEEQSALESSKKAFPLGQNFHLQLEKLHETLVRCLHIPTLW